MDGMTYPYLFYIAKLRLHIKRISEKFPKEKPKTQNAPGRERTAIPFRPGKRAFRQDRG